MTVHYDEARTQLRQIRVKGASFSLALSTAGTGSPELGFLRLTITGLNLKRQTGRQPWKCNPN